MKELIIKRLNEIRKEQKNFPASTMRWEKFTLYDCHISRVIFENLEDLELLVLFERLIRQLNKAY